MNRSLAVAVAMTVVLGACSTPPEQAAPPTAGMDTSTSTAPTPIVTTTQVATSTIATPTPTTATPTTTVSTSTTTTKPAPTTTTSRAPTTTAPQTTTTTPPTTTTTAPPPTTTTTAATIDLVALGREVSVAAGCTVCHSSDGSPGLGPTWSDAYGSTVLLDDGSTVTATAAYVRESIVDPNVRIVDGYFPGLMQDGYAITLSAADIDAIVAYIASL